MHTCVSLSPRVGSKSGTWGPLPTLLLELIFYLTLGNCWWAKAEGTLKQFAALNKNLFEQRSGNDSGLIMFEFVVLCSVTVICAVNNVKSSIKRKEQKQIGWHKHKGGGMICSFYWLRKCDILCCNPLLHSPCSSFHTMSHEWAKKKYYDLLMND